VYDTVHVSNCTWQIELIFVVSVFRSCILMVITKTYINHYTILDFHIPILPSFNRAFNNLLEEGIDSI
jgi:hypothetical protein